MLENGCNLMKLDSFVLKKIFDWVLGWMGVFCWAITFLKRVGLRGWGLGVGGGGLGKGMGWCRSCEKYPKEFIADIE